MQPLPRIHLYSSHLQADSIIHGNSQYVYIFSGASLFLLVIACINFMNLATARSLQRAREVGLRKVVGAVCLQLIFQFLTESLLLVLLVGLLSLGLVRLLLPSFNDLAGKQLSLSIFSG